MLIFECKRIKANLLVQPTRFSRCAPHCCSVWLWCSLHGEVGVYLTVAVACISGYSLHGAVGVHLTIVACGLGAAYMVR